VQCNQRHVVMLLGPGNEGISSLHDASDDF
jgi:hypothetical protein